MEGNDEEITMIPKLSKGQESNIIPGEDDWYTVKKGKAVKNKTEQKKGSNQPSPKQKYIPKEQTNNPKNKQK